MPLNYYLRPFASDDYPAVIALGRSAFDDDMQMDIETLRRIDESRTPKHPWGRPLAIRDEDGQIHGMAQWGQLRGTDSFFFWIAVHPGHRRHGLGSALYRAILEAVAPYDPPSVLTWDRRRSGSAGVPEEARLRGKVARTEKPTLSG